MMKKAKELKQTRKTNQNFFKYIQPSKVAGFSHQTKSQTRSMMDLESNVRYQQTAREVSNSNKENHHLSLCNHTEEQEQETKSNSLKKFLSLFGSNSSNNPILNPTGNSTRLSTGRQQKSSSRGSNRQVFTCNIKNMNVNVSSSKDKENIENKTTLILKNHKTEAQSHFAQLKAEKEELKRAQQILTQQFSERERALKDKVKYLQNQNSSLKQEIISLNGDKLIDEEKFALRERSLEKIIDSLQKNASKERCREHDLIIESLKKVINEQLRKIIELEKSKIEREEIEKLEERINKNMTGNHEGIIKQSLHYMEVKELLKLSKMDEIKIADDSFNQSALTSHNENSRFEMIEEAEESEQCSREKSQEEGDSILEEVDKYLVQWRNKY